MDAYFHHHCRTPNNDHRNPDCSLEYHCNTFDNDQFDHHFVCVQHAVDKHLHNNSAVNHHYQNFDDHALEDYYHYYVNHHAQQSEYYSLSQDHGSHDEDFDLQNTTASKRSNMYPASEQSRGSHSQCHCDTCV